MKAFWELLGGAQRHDGPPSWALGGRVGPPDPSLVSHCISVRYP